MTTNSEWEKPSYRLMIFVASSQHFSHRFRRALTASKNSVILVRSPNLDTKFSSFPRDRPTYATASLLVETKCRGMIGRQTLVVSS